jgi:hypothetical protein
MDLMIEMNVEGKKILLAFVWHERRYSRRRKRWMRIDDVRVIRS